VKYHNGNANKMVSDTPRTDDESFFMHHSKYDYCKADLARQLERELNAANARLKRLEEAGDKMAELIDGGVFMKYAVQWYEAKEAKP